MSKPVAIDLFCGCGGLTLGLKQAGFKVIGAIDIDRLAIETYRKNHEDVDAIWARDIRHLTARQVRRRLDLQEGDLDLLAGCPPCQDVNPSQEALIRELHRRCSTLFVVGDDDQAIYSWRGADVSNILSFRRRYPECAEHTLSHNFRSTPSIVTAADGFVSAELGATRIAKNPEASEPAEPRDFRNLWFSSRAQESQWVATRIEALLATTYPEGNGAVRGLTPGDFAILMRSTRTDEQDGSPRHAAFTEALDGRGIRYTLEASGGVFDRPQVSVLRDTFELLRNGSPNRETADEHFNNLVRPAFPQADFEAFVRVLGNWGRQIHTPIAGARRRVYPQQMVHDLLNAFGIQRSNFDADVMHDLGVFSRIIQDVHVEWAVDRIIAGDFPMRPERDKCDACDFKALCPKTPEQFTTDTMPPPVHVPGAIGAEMVRAFSDFEDD